MAGLFARFKETLITQVSSDPSVDLTHSVEANLFSVEAPYLLLGRLTESRWSNGIGSFTLTLNAVPQEHDGLVRLYIDGKLVAGFDFLGRRLDYSWIGKRTAETPGYEAGQRVEAKVGWMNLSGTVIRKQE